MFIIFFFFGFHFLFLLFFNFDGLTICHPSPTPATCHPSPLTRYPLPVTRYPSPATRHPSPATRGKVLPPIRQAFVGLSALTGTCFDELRAVTVELAMEGWVDDSEIAVVDWEMNFCLCCNRYSTSWSAKVIGVDRSALIISGEFSSGLASDALGDISPSGTSQLFHWFVTEASILSHSGYS